jgi:hypothetical protein
LSLNDPTQLTTGRDSYRGRSGPENQNPGGGSKPYDSATANPARGYDLELFRGKWLEKLSIVEIEDDEAAEQAVEEDRSDREFLSKMGFIKNGQTLQ